MNFDHPIVIPNVEPYPDDWCYGCMQREPIPPGGAYLVCGECFHVYATADDLVDTFNRRGDELADLEPAQPRSAWVLDPERINFCPICIHDF